MKKWLVALAITAIVCGQTPAVKKKPPADVLQNISRLLDSLRQSVARGVNESDAAAKELNDRIEKISRDVQGALKEAERHGHGSDAEVRLKVKNDIRSFSSYVESLSDSVFRQMHHTVDELQQQAENVE